MTIANRSYPEYQPYFVSTYDTHSTDGKSWLKPAHTQMLPTEYMPPGKYMSFEINQALRNNNIEIAEYIASILPPFVQITIYPAYFKDVSLETLLKFLDNERFWVCNVVLTAITLSHDINYMKIVEHPRLTPADINIIANVGVDTLKELALRYTPGLFQADFF